MPVQLRNSELVELLRPDLISGLVPINEVLVGVAGVATVSFTTIPQTYRALLAIVSARSTIAATGSYADWRANGDAGANYDYVEFYASGAAHGAGSSFGGTSSLGIRIDAANSRANCFGGGIIVWINYSDANVEKDALEFSYSLGNVLAANIIIEVVGCHWRSTTAITSLTFLDRSGGNFAQYSRFKLYGIL
jgi:hypothetical protein